MALLIAGGIAADNAVSQSSKTVFLIRHAEKTAEPANDPHLTAEGEERAAALVEVLKDANIAHVISTQFERTRRTAKPVADYFSIESKIVGVTGSLSQHLDDVANAVRALPDGDAILVVGHSNTIPAIIGRLGGPDLEDLEETEYSWLFVLVLTEGREPVLARATFGAHR